MGVIKRYEEAPYRFLPVRIVRSPCESLQGVADKYNASAEVQLHSQCVYQGLEEWEESFLKTFAIRKGRILNVGCGAGREAIAFAGLNFDVTGIDIAGQMIAAARDNAKTSNVTVKFEVRPAHEIDYPAGHFDYVVFSRAVYSYIPTRDLRIETLRRVKRVLKEDGLGVFSAYYYGRRRWFSRTYLLDIIRKAVSLVMGNKFRTEPGDTLLARVSEASDPRKLFFCHFFASPQEIIKEIEAAGLTVVEGEKTGFWVVKP